MQGKISGNYHVWSLLGHERGFADVTLTYKEAVEYIMPVRYNALTGRGEQRELFEAHVRKLRKEMEDGNYTPTQISAGLRKSHLASLVRQEDGTFELTVDSGDPLPQTDGGHRYEALSRIEKSVRESLKKDPENVELNERLDEILTLPIGVRIYFDGSPQRDFINLQAGRTVDAAHMLSMRIQQRVIDDPAFKIAFDVAKILLKADDSPFKGQIRLDSRGINPLPISTLCSKGASDLGTSLVGLAKIGLFANKKADWLANIIIDVYRAIATKCPAVLEGGKVLTTIANGGSKGSATMLVGVAVCAAYRLVKLGREWDQEEDANRLCQSVAYALYERVNGRFSGPDKRKLLGDFAKDYFHDCCSGRHDGLPVELLRLLSPSAFGASPLPKPRKTAADGQVEVTDEPTPVAVAAAAAEEEAMA